MKQVILIIVAVSWCSFTFSQVSEEILKEVQRDNQCTKLDFSMEVLELIDTEMNINGVEKYLKGDFKRAKLLIIEEKINMEKVMSTFLNEGFRKYPMENKEENMQLIYLKDGNKISEAHMFIEGEEEEIILSLYVDVKIVKKQ